MTFTAMRPDVGLSKGREVSLFRLAQRVAEDHAVRPVLVVLVEIGLVRAFRHSVELGEQIKLNFFPLPFLLLRLFQQIVN